MSAADDFSYSSSVAQQQPFSPKRRTRNAPNTVPPQPVNDRTLLDSVTGFLNDVTQASGNSQFDPKETIQWARFETAADPCDPTIGDDWDVEGGVAPPLLLVLGYGSGVQCWAIPANGEAVEVLSWRHGSVRTLRLLPHPLPPTGVVAGNADAESVDKFAEQRPLMAICDASAASNAPFCSVNFVSLRGGETVKSIKFKTPILDIVANRSAVVISFSDRVAVFDARTLEDRMTVTTCHPGVSVSPNPVALGSRWMAYAERKLIPAKRSCGGCDGDGVASYTATVLNAAKSLGKGLRELGGQMAAGFAGSGSISGYGGNSQNGNGGAPDDLQPGIVTIMDIKYPIKENSPTTGTPVTATGSDPIVAHFVAHSEAIIALSFDFSGMLLATADKRGHDFHVFRIQPHPGGPSLSAVHHLYVLHRGDTTAKVQCMTFSLDSRWLAVSTLRGTTHVFPVTPYGGAAGVRTHGSPHVVNRLSRFHRSAGLSVDGVRSASPVHSSGGSSSGQQSGNNLTHAYSNPRISPYPHPTVVLPLAQLRQPSQLNPPLGSNSMQNGGGGSGSARPRLTSLTDDSKPLRVCTTFAKARAWLLEPPGGGRDIPSMRLQQRKAVDSLFVMGSHGALIQYDLDPKTNSAISKDRICDDTAIELDVEPRAQWNLQRRDGSTEIEAPLAAENWLLKDRLADSVDANAGGSLNAVGKDGAETGSGGDEAERALDDQWLSQVEIITHAGPHRRLWMGPQFMFKTYNAPSGGPLSLSDLEAVEVGVGGGSCNRPARSNPVNMPTPGGVRPNVEVLIESGSYELSPRLSQQRDDMGSDQSLSNGDLQLREDLADAMRESPGRHSRNSTGLAGGNGHQSAKFQTPSSSSSSSSCTSFHHVTHAPYYHHHSQPQQQRTVSIAKVVNPLGTVTTTHRQMLAGQDEADELDDYLFNSDAFIHENCDEALFRPVVAVFGSTGRIGDVRTGQDVRAQAPADIGQSFVVPVIELKQPSAKAAAPMPAKTTNTVEVSGSAAKIVPVRPIEKERKKSDTKAPPANVQGKEIEKERKKSDVKAPPANVVATEIEKERKKSDTKAPPVNVVAKEIFVPELQSDSMSAKPKEVEAPLTKASKKAQKKAAAAAAAAKLLDRVADHQESKSAKTDEPKPSKNEESKKTRRNSSQKVEVEIHAEPTAYDYPDEEVTSPRVIVRNLETSIAVPLEDVICSAPLSSISFEDMMRCLDTAGTVPDMDDDDFFVAAGDCNRLSESKSFAKLIPVPTPASDLCDPPPVAAIRSKKPKKYVDQDADTLTVIECFEQENYSIQDSIFVDPVITSTVVVKKTGRKSKRNPAAIIDTSPIEEHVLIKDTDSAELEFVDAFSPMESFELNFEHLSLSRAASVEILNSDKEGLTVADDFVSLINFISPTEEHADSSIVDIETVDEEDDIPALERSRSHHDDDFDVQEDAHETGDSDEPPVLLYECPESDYTSFEHEIEDSFLSIDQTPTHDTKESTAPSMPHSRSTSSSVSSGEESSSQLTTTTTITAPASLTGQTPYKMTDDEELQPLITSNTVSAHMFASQESPAHFTLPDPLPATPLDDGQPSHYDKSAADRDVELGACGDMQPPEEPPVKLGSAAGRSAKKSKKKRR